MSAPQIENNAFETCLGTEVNQLPEVVRRAHVGKIRLGGYAQVFRGRGVANTIATFMGLPAAAERVAMSVEADHLADRMTWKRRFGEQAFESCFRLQRGRLIESLGPLQLQLRLEVREHRLRYVLERATLLGLPVPQRLAPSLEAWEGERDGRYEFAVDVRLPFIGRLVRYEGLLDLDA